VNVDYVNVLDHPIVKLDGGGDGYRRGLLAGSQAFGDAHLLYAFEAFHDDGPWVHPDGFRKYNGVLRLSSGSAESGFSVTAMAYNGRWNATDQIAERSVADGTLSRFGAVDPTDGGSTRRTSLSAEWQETGEGKRTKVTAYAIGYDLNLFSNFTYFLDDPVHGDQLEQEDRRVVLGAKASREWIGSLFGFDAESTIGVQVRHDNISALGLYHTEARQRLETIRADHVRQASFSLYGDSRVQWTSKLRTVVGLRADLYRFDVASDQPGDSGATTPGIVSPKLSIVLGPFAGTELYLDGGFGFHSNDGRGATLARDRVSPLVRAKGAEAGMRSAALPGVSTSFAAWMLDLDSELVFSGDSGTTEPSRASRRVGLEWASTWSALSWLTLEADLAWSRARFTEHAPEGDHVPGSIEGVGTLGASVSDLAGFSGSLRLRYFGPRSLSEDGRVRSSPSTLLNARVGYQVARGLRLDVDVFNVLNHATSDVDYFYTSRLPGEPAEGVADVHFHPVSPRTVRAGLVATF
jgi:hypothetical protein